MSKFKHKNGKEMEYEKKKVDRIPDETINYYKRVSETLNEDFSSDEDKDIFLSNVFGQLKEDGVKICRLASTSRIFERLVVMCEPHHLKTLLQIFQTDWGDMLTDRFASHVLQDAISQVPRCLRRKNEVRTIEDTPESGVDLSVEELFLDLCGHMKDNLMYCMDVYGSHIVRVLLQVLAGTTVDEQVIRSRLSRNQRKDQDQQQKQLEFDTFDPPHDFQKMLKRLTKEIFKIDNLNDCFCSASISPVIQTVLLVHHKKAEKKSKKYIQKVLDASDLSSQPGDTTSLPRITTDEIGSYLVEQILNLGSVEVYRDIYKTVFKGRLLHYAIHPVGNFILQKLLTNVTEKDLFDEMFEEVSVLLEDLLALNHLGVVTRLAETCLRLGCLQEKLVKCIMEAFHCADPVERQTKLAPLLLSLTTYEVYFGIEEETEQSDVDKAEKTEEVKKKILTLTAINYHGSVLVQNLLRFGNPKVVVSGVLELTPVELRTLACDPCGSHVLDVFCESPTMGEKSRDQLIKKMKGVYMDIACNKNGSRTLDNLWKLASLPQKLIIVEELGRNEAKLQGDRFGFYVHRNCGVFQYQHRRNEWKEVQGQSQKKRKLFHEILSDGPAVKKVKGKDKMRKPKSDEDDMDGSSLRVDWGEDTGVVSSGNSTQLSERPTKQPKTKKDKKQQKGHGEHQIRDKDMKNVLTEMCDKSTKKKSKKKR